MLRASSSHSGVGHSWRSPLARQLALKHRQNKSQRQRIVLFVGSPLEEDERALVRLGKKLKKYNVAVDVVNFGEQNDNVAKLEAFVNAVDSGNRCACAVGRGRTPLAVGRSPIVITGECR